MLALDSAPCGPLPKVAVLSIRKCPTPRRYQALLFLSDDLPLSELGCYGNSLHEDTRRGDPDGPIGDRVGCQSAPSHCVFWHLSSLID